MFIQNLVYLAIGPSFCVLHFCSMFASKTVIHVVYVAIHYNACTCNTSN